MSQQLPLKIQLQASAQFSNFVAGSNQELVSQLQRSACGDDEGFVVCWGGAGSGKSHLLQACCHQAGEYERSVAYLSFEQVSKLSGQVLEDWEHYDLICLDDIQAIAGLPEWEEALFHLYNRVRDRNGCLVISSSSPPNGLPLALPDLHSRLSWGLVYQILSLDEKQCMQTLRLRAQQRGCELPEETVAYLLRRVPRDLVALLKILDCLDEASLAAQRRLTVPFVKSVLDL